MQPTVGLLLSMPNHEVGWRVRQTIKLSQEPEASIPNFRNLAAFQMSSVVLSVVLLASSLSTIISISKPVAENLHVQYTALAVRRREDSYGICPTTLETGSFDLINESYSRPFATRSEKKLSFPEKPPYRHLFSFLSS